MIGTTISHYNILEKLGEGGMGVVYKAQDTKLDRFVALKFLPEHLNASVEDEARFVQEAKAAAALNHPNVCSIIDISEHVSASGGKQMFIVMEFIDGQTLREKMKPGILSVKSAIDIGIQVAEGLSAAHDKGIVHRDIKPENIMVRKDGIVQIMDFGLAKLRLSRGSRLTREGSTIGTAGYMSPEQVQGRETDHRSDIFSLGVLLYEMCAGRLPFQGAHETAMLYEIVNVVPPPPSVIRPDLDPELDRVILECLQKEPDERYNSVKDIAKDLKRAKRESGRQQVSRITSSRSIPDQRSRLQAAATPEGSRWGRLALPGFLCVVIVALLFLIWHIGYRGENASAEVVRFLITAPPEGVYGPIVAISPDGREIAYVQDSEGSDLLYLRNLASLESRPVAGTEGAGAVYSSSSFVFFSPDAQWLGFMSEGSLKKISVRGGTATTLSNAPALRGGSWGDDNTILFTPGTSVGVSRVSASGGTPEVVSFPDSAAGEISHRYPEMLPGSKAFLFTVKTNSITKFSEAKIAVQRIGSKEKKIIIEGGSFARYSSSGHILYGQGGSIYAVPFDADRLEITGTPIKVLDGGKLLESFGSLTFAVSATGTIVYAPGSQASRDSNSIVQYDRKGNSRMLVEHPGRYASVSVSPDNERIAYYQQAANDDVWIYDIQRRLSTRFTFAGGNNWYPMWSRDGKRIVFTAERGGAPNLFWKQVDGTGKEERLATSPYVQFPDSWSPDGKLLAYHQGNADGNTDVLILSTENDRKPQAFLNSKFNESFASFSPDGRWIAYNSDESGKVEVYAVPFPKGDGKWQVSTGGGLYPSWTKGGSEIMYYNDDHRSIVKVPITFTPEFHPGRGEALFTFSGPPLYTPDISPDGEHVSVVIGGKQAENTQLVVVVRWFEELKKQLAAK